jgi:hypothetical protein
MMVSNVPPLAAIARRGAVAVVPAIAAFCALLWLHSLYFTWKYFSITPFWDIWAWLRDYQAYAGGHYTLHDLFKPHNEHRIVTTRLVLFADAWWCHMTGRLAVALNLALLASIGALLGCLAWPPDGSKARQALALLLPIAWMSSTCQWVNLLQPFQIQFALLCVSFVGAALLLLRATTPALPRRRALAWAGLAGLCALSAVFSMAGGLLALPWLFLLPILRRAHWAPASLFAAVAAAAALLFLHDYHPDRAAPLALAADLHILRGLITFASGFLASAFYAYGDGAFALGAAGLASFAACALWLLWRVLVQGVALPGRTLALFTIAGTIVLTAGAAAVSRLGFGMGLALAPRYATPSLVFWASLVPLVLQVQPVFPGAPRNGFRYATHLAVAAALAALALCNLAPRYTSDARGYDGVMESQAESMRQNVYVPQLFSVVAFGDKSDWAGTTAFLRAHHLSVFAPGAGAPPPPALLAPVLASTATPVCAGAFSFAYRLDAQRFVVRGWLASIGGRRTADWIAFAAPGGTIAAIVPATEYLGHLRAGRFKIRRTRGIYGGVTAAGLPPDGDAALTAFGLFAGDAALTCHAAAPVVLPALRVQPITGLAALSPLPVSARPAPGPAFTAQTLSGGFPPAPWRGDTILTSGVTGDGATAAAALAAAPAPGQDIAIPFMSGPDARGESLDAVFPDGATARLALPPDMPDSIWRAATLPRADIARHGGAVTIIARDAGTEWGEWMAIGTPMATRLDPDWARLY